MRGNQGKERGERFVSQNQVTLESNQMQSIPHLLGFPACSPHTQELICWDFPHMQIDTTEDFSGVANLSKSFTTVNPYSTVKNYRTTCENILLLLSVIPLSVILRHHTPVNISLPPRRISPVSKLYPIHTPENFSALLRKISPVYPGRFLRLIDKVIDHTIDPP